MAITATIDVRQQDLLASLKTFCTTLLEQEAIDQKEHLRRQTEFENASSEFAVAESNLHSYGLDQTTVDGLLHEARRPDRKSAAMTPASSCETSAPGASSLTIWFIPRNFPSGFR